MRDKTLVQRFLSSLVDTLHYWSGIMLNKPAVPPVPTATPAPPSQVNASPPTPTLGAVVAKQVMVVFTLMLDPPLADELSKLAQAMQVNESDVLIRLIKIARMIREFGLYGVPTLEGNYLGIFIQKTGEIQRIHIECPAQKDHHPPKAPDSGKPPSIMN